jgi:hypothetical protein
VIGCAGGETVDMPANAPHQFRNKIGQAASAHVLACQAGRFAKVGVPVATRTRPMFSATAILQQQPDLKAEHRYPILIRLDYSKPLSCHSPEKR